MVGIGIVGLGFMGMIHYLASRGLAEGRVVALASRDPRKLAGDWSGIRGNFGPQGGPMDLTGLHLHADPEALIADPAVDLVDLCVPNDEHARLAIRALEAGKHVLVEKPIALTLPDAEAMVAASRASGRLLMVAHVLPFFPEFAFAAEAVRSGRYGRLLAADFERVVASAGAIADLDRSGGPAIDLHIHDTHYIGLICGPPRAVRSVGVVDRGTVVHLSTQYLYGPGGPAVSAVSGALSRAGRPFAHGFTLYLEGATLAFASATLGGEAHAAMPLAVILPDGSVERPSLGSGDPVEAFAAEIATAVAGVTSGVEPAALSGDLARRALALCGAEVESVLSGESVAVGET